MKIRLPKSDWVWRGFWIAVYLCFILLAFWMGTAVAYGG